MKQDLIFQKPIRWGIIGCGDVTEIKSGPAYQLTEGFQLCAVMRRDLEKLKDYAQRHGIEKHYSDADDLINDPEIDAVYIATPPDSHLLYAQKVAETGKICCIEKPLAPSYSESVAIENAFKNNTAPLFTAYYRRSLPRFKQVHDWIKNEDIGQVRHVAWHLSKAPEAVDFTGNYNWRTDPIIAPGGYFDDLASHGLDLITFLLGNIQDAHGFSLNQQQLYKAKDAFSACWVHENGITGTGSWNFGCDQTDDRIELFGSRGKIEFSIFENTPLTIVNDQGRNEIHIENPRTIQKHHVEDMKKHIFDTDFNHPSNGTTAAHTSWVMDKILGTL